ncbi:MAG: RidA family protein [Planctomycetaceae bacterium]|nr:RidA family protein [Planctomycetaceae bacterium]
MSARQYHNPTTLHRSPAFSHGVSVPATARTVYVGGQNAIDATAQLAGAGDLFAQTVKTLQNLEAVLQDARATLQDVVKWTVLMVQGQNATDGLRAFDTVWGDRPNPPAITVAFVSGLAVPGALVEIEAVAVVPEAGGPG